MAARSMASGPGSPLAPAQPEGGNEEQDHSEQSVRPEPRERVDLEVRELLVAEERRREGIDLHRGGRREVVAVPVHLVREGPESEEAEVEVEHEDVEKVARLAEHGAAEEEKAE